MRARNRDALRSAQEDIDANSAGLGVLRLKRDPAFRKRYRLYLRGEIDYRAFMDGETNAQWWQRVRDEVREAAEE